MSQFSSNKLKKQIHNLGDFCEVVFSENLKNRYSLAGKELEEYADILYTLNEFKNTFLHICHTPIFEVKEKTHTTLIHKLDQAVVDILLSSNNIYLYSIFLSDPYFNENKKLERDIYIRFSISSEPKFKFVVNLNPDTLITDSQKITIETINT